MTNVMSQNMLFFNLFLLIGSSLITPHAGTCFKSCFKSVW